MTSNESGNLWFLQQPPQPGADHKQQSSPPPPSQQAYQSPNPANPFAKLTQSPPPQDGSVYSAPQPGYGQQPLPPQQGSPYPQQQGSPYPPQQGGLPQYTSQPGSPYPQQAPPYPQQAFTPPQQQGAYPPQQSVYAQSGPFTPPQQGYPQQQGSPYPQQAYAQQKQYSDPDSQVGGESSSFYNSGPPPVVQSGQGPGGPGDRAFFDNAMQMAGVQQPPPGPDGLERGWFTSSKNPLDPPPKMFKRPAPAHYSYIKFQPLSVLAVSDKLQDGFALIPPVTAPGDQHPFVSHDITEDDWHKFLKDFQKTAHLSPSDRLFQGMANSFMKDKIPSAKVQKRMAENKLEPIGDYLVAWNHYFFHPRRMSVVLARGSQRFSGETDDYPPDVTRRTKRASKEKKKKTHGSTRSVDRPLVTVAEPYPRGSLLAPLLNPIHKALYDTTVAVTRAPGDLIYGIKPGERVDLSRSSPKSKSRAVRDSEEESDSEEYTDSEEESDEDHSRAWERKVEKDVSAANRKAEGDLKAFHKKAAADREALHSLMQGRRAERKERIEERKRDREEYIQRTFYGNYDAGKKEDKPRKHRKHRREREGSGDIPTGKFRLVICYWDGQREEF